MKGRKLEDLEPLLQPWTEQGGPELIKIWHHVPYKVVMGFRR